MPQTLRIRRSLTDLQYDYEKGNKQPLDDLMRAWHGITKDDPSSFFTLGGYHGEPFRGAGWGSSAWWGGYCNHGNILFPTWHRMYLYVLENALRAVPGCQDVTLPFWDETNAESLSGGVPWALTDYNYTFANGTTISNPLRSFVFPLNIQDNINGDDPNYSKPAGYETVRYPLSGLVGTPADQQATAAHNAQFPNYNQNVVTLNNNVVAWLTSYIVVNGQKIPTHVAQAYESCLNTPYYTVFSNTTSAAQWNTNLPSGTQPLVPLEQPHNDIHLAVGGYDVESGPNAADFSPIPGANGDMGENDTAGLDPIFFFHHAHIDRMFWLWQQKWGSQDNLDVWSEYPGTNSVDSQGPTPGIMGGSWLTLDTPLNPFQKTDGQPYTSRDCINIETQLGYTYGPGSLSEVVEQEAAAPRSDARVLRVSGINRAAIRGSFLVSAYAEIDGMRQCIGREGHLSRWSVQGCANCQTHLEARSHFSLEGLDDLNESDIEVEVRTRDGVLTPATEQALTPEPAKKPFRVEVVTADEESPMPPAPVAG